MNKPDVEGNFVATELLLILAEKDLALEKLIVLLDSRTKITNSDELDKFSDVVTIQRDHVRLKNELIECNTHCGAGDMNSHSLEFLGSHLSHDYETT